MYKPTVDEEGRVIEPTLPTTNGPRFRSFFEQFATVISPDDGEYGIGDDDLAPSPWPPGK